MNTKALVVIFAALALSYVLTAVAQDYRGFGDQYVVQVGELNGDGLKDLHLQYRPRVALINLDDISVPIAESCGFTLANRFMRGVGGSDLVIISIA